METKIINNDWVEVSGYSGRYLVNKYGQIKSTSKYVSKARYYYPQHKDKILKPAKTKSKYNSGYLFVRLSSNGKSSTKYIHRILAEAFIPNPFGLPQVNHIDGNSLNNSLKNLEWVTANDNINHSWDKGLVKRSATRITDKIIGDVLNMSNGGASQVSIARILNIDPSNVSRIINKKRRFYEKTA